MKIGIISDTHGKLHPPVLELIASCDVVACMPEMWITVRHWISSGCI